MRTNRSGPEPRRGSPGRRESTDDRYAEDDDRYPEDDDRYDDEDESYEEEVEPIPAGEAAREGLRQASQLTGRDPSGVTSVQPTQDGWRIGVELVEDHRIPASTDLLGLYEVDLDADGEVLSFRRVRRYQRGKGEVG
ncbi:gas vesicle protein [Micromonospora inyonensis]|uniref:Gas vesicle synthesis protein GvpO n=1 Tax=Micromonospora inyonensis TaxID=47866 RepID=A0A1C6RC52_9ACTN|nr:gas vesicle protein [Micromonospora inyonensis]SCL14562.1 Gas vesicle synthesis protein GvpO [Micromonospora inyonensis]